MVTTLSFPNHFHSYINQRNRLKNQQDSEEAAKREIAEMRTATADPFTRRQCRPTMVTKVPKDNHFICRTELLFAAHCSNFNTVSSKIFLFLCVQSKDPAINQQIKARYMDKYVQNAGEGASKVNIVAVGKQV